MITPENFICTFCGKCCMYYTVKLSDRDIKKIERLGYMRKEFAERDGFDLKTGSFSLRKINNKCVFLHKRDKKFFCSIYEYRPEICRRYPFFSGKAIESCIPEVRRWKTSLVE